MNEAAILDIFSQGIYLTILLVGSIVLPGLLVGLLVAMFQAATQINEMSLSFIPKLMVTLFALSVLAPWILNIMIEFTRNLFIQIPNMLG
jgi:flagellar biosynthesis protein FliQ